MQPQGGGYPGSQQGYPAYPPQPQAGGGGYPPAYPAAGGYPPAYPPQTGYGATQGAGGPGLFNALTALNDCTIRYDGLC